MEQTAAEKITAAEQKPSIYTLQLHELKDWLKENNEKAFRAEQILIGFTQKSHII